MGNFRFFIMSACLALGMSLQFSPVTERPTLIGPASAQETIGVDYFYDQLGPYGQWVWHPRFGYVWLPDNVSEDWRPYTVGHWIYTDDYGWYWQSEEPFAWAVYHYGRWGYDPDYGWFWVPGDTWAPAWVQWRYSDQYVGWAPVGPAAAGYAYGPPVSYDPPVAEAWVFVEPRYVAAPDIYRYCVPIPRLNVVFLNATTVYHPEFRGGVVFNMGIPRETVVKITNRPIVVEKIVRVQNQTNIYEKGGGGVKVFAPPVAKGKPQGMPKHFVDSPSEFKPKAKLTATVEGAPPKGLGPTVATIKPITSEVRPEEFKKHVIIGATSAPGAASTGRAPTSPSVSGQGEAETETGLEGKKKKHAGPGPGFPGGPGSPGGANAPVGQGQASGPGKNKKNLAPGAGGPMGPVGSNGPGSGENGPGGPGKKPRPGAAYPGGNLDKQAGNAPGKHAKPDCAKTPELPACKGH
jgi:Family of unknown function (DUF6600)